MKKQVYTNEQLIKLFLDQDYSKGPITGTTSNKKYYVVDGTLYLASDDFVIAEFIPSGDLGIAMHPTDMYAGQFTAQLALYVVHRPIQVFSRDV